MSGLVVLEGKWSKTSNVSVKSLFDVLIDMTFDSPHQYYFSSFANAEALKDILRDTCGRYCAKKYLYIGAHGDDAAIYGSINSISRTAFRNILAELGGQMKGVFLGSCLFGHKSNAAFLFEGVPPTVTWIAGYGKSVDWIESSVLDLLFWHTFFREAGNANTPIEHIERACNRMVHEAQGLIKKWELQVFVRPHGRGTELRELIQH